MTRRSGWKLAISYTRLFGYAGPSTAKSTEVFTKYIITDMYAKAAQGMKAEDAVAWADGELKKIFSALVAAAESSPLILEGVARPHPQYVYAGMSLQRRLIVDMLRALRELAGGAFQQLPSAEAGFESPTTRADLERFHRGATVSARERVKLLKLVWDFVGTEFGGRQLQYEMFYSAAQPVVNTRMFRSYDWAAAPAFADRCLGEY